MVGAIIGWFFLGLLALIVLVLVLPVTIKLEFRGGELGVWARVLFVRVRVFPRPDKPKKEKKPKKKRTKRKGGEEDAEDKQKAKRSFGETWAMIKRLAAAGVEALKPFIRHLRINAVQLVIPVHADEAADTAVRCGQVQAAVGVVRGWLDGRLKVRFKRIVVIPDFADQYGKELFFACKICFSPGIIFVMLFKFLRRYLRKRPYSKRAYKQAIAEKQAAAQARRAQQNGPDAA